MPHVPYHRQRLKRPRKFRSRQVYGYHSRSGLHRSLDTRNPLSPRVTSKLGVVNTAQSAFGNQAAEIAALDALPLLIRTWLNTSDTNLSAVLAQSLVASLGDDSAVIAELEALVAALRRK